MRETQANALGIGEDGKNALPELIGDVGHAGEVDAPELVAVAREELVERVVGEVVRAADVEGYEVARVAHLHPRLEHAVVEAVELAGAEEAQPGYPAQHVDQALRREVRRCHVQLLHARFLPLNLHHVLALQVCELAKYTTSYTTSIFLYSLYPDEFITLVTRAIPSLLFC